MFSQYKTLAKLAACVALPYLVLMAMLSGVWSYLGMLPEGKLMVHYLVTLIGGAVFAVWFLYPFYVIWVGADKQYLDTATYQWVAKPITRAHQIAATTAMLDSMIRLLVMMPLILLSYLVVPVLLLTLPAGARTFPKALDWFFGYHGGLPGETFQERLIGLFSNPCNRLATALGTTLGSTTTYNYWGSKNKPGTPEQPSGGFVILDGRICEIVKVVYFGNLFGKYPLNMTMRYGHQASKFTGPFIGRKAIDEPPVVPIGTTPVKVGLVG